MKSVDQPSSWPAPYEESNPPQVVMAAERPDSRRIFAGLNSEQRRAVLETRGPVCILAGAGSGKTTTITRRIAWQVVSGAFPADQILAVTFTDKAAAEMRSRLKALGVEGVTARTFHAAALGQLRWLVPDRVGEILPSKGLVVRRIANTLPRPFCYRHASDLAQEIERAKNRRITPDLYLEALNGHEPPLPADLMQRVYRSYEREKRSAGRVDFEDLLELAVRLYEEDEQAAVLLRERFHAFTVDEYQDVNLLQQALLDLWLGERDELCAVGDDFQAVYGFTGATPAYLLGLPERFPGATVVTLESNYRSTPQVLALANRLVPRMGGAARSLRATRSDGAEPERHVFDHPGEEKLFVVERVKALREQEGLSYEQMAILVRTNARAADFEEPLAGAEIPFQGSSLLERESARHLLRRAATLEASGLARGVRRLAHAQGWVGTPPPRLGDREMTRLADMTRLVRLAEELDDGRLDGVGFAAEIRRRFDPRAAGRGVHLLTYHQAKGLEFTAVFLPRLEEKELPCKLSLHKAEELAEERRLFYVGLTRAKRHLVLSWTERARPSRFLIELEVAESAPARRRRAGAEGRPPGFEQLRAWRRERARTDGVPAFAVFTNRALAAIAVSRPVSLEELAQVRGVGPKKIERYGDEVLAVLASLEPESER
jgi:DNA helicase-2/ATP-dependent DNA helicase PcrA